MPIEQTGVGKTTLIQLVLDDRVIPRWFFK